ncbi:LysR substrate-binding domain-containing protein [Rodentibacter trehalosifermentans]|uniref:LysR family transcriptional regulator n=1 Tax=Rodentibacter trehalosifermentans TaxID=1908263 RepID=A0A1V3IR56_9PAST|nr:LysR substrate-binding domain-containing protein [Rodentibacter trehalosifermentans]OOF44399.1 LysR family transcriptional regulator [Rodentibacter trehalosifermentans]OOF47775.1 LysR family transcriptional regulator [Rodentibacter trehalosifermentans]OOF52584.1 LysR family transcriptional regulator [Rodentibacter trehalosifermentans]
MKDNSYYGQLNVFQTIAQEGSISAAARKLQIAVPSASQSLKLLEQKIGVPLFHRTTRNIQLTEAGRQLLAQTETAMMMLNQALEEIQHFNSEPTGTVRITLSRFAYQLILRSHLAEFHERYPQIQLEISLNDALVNLLEEGFDLGIRFGNRIEEGMVARKLLPAFKEGLYVTKAYIKQYGKPKTPKDLTTHRLIGYRFISSNRIEPLVLNIDGKDTALNIDTPLLCNDPEIIADAARQGIGIGRIFEPNMQLFEDKDDFIPILQKHWREYPPLYLYYLQHNQKSRKMQTVIEFLLEKTKK